MPRQIRNPTTGEWQDAPSTTNGKERDIDMAHGKIRRAGDGTRQHSQFFSAENAERTLTRGDYLNVRASEEFGRREQSWLRKTWRYLTGRPQVIDLNSRIADAHGRNLDRMALAMKARAEAKAEAREEEPGE